jgi:hypothetical protein
LLLPANLSLLLFAGACCTREERQREGRVGARVPIGMGTGAVASMVADAYTHLEVCGLLSFNDALVALLDASKHNDSASFTLELMINLHGELGELGI